MKEQQSIVKVEEGMESIKRKQGPFHLVIPPGGGSYKDDFKKGKWSVGEIAKFVAYLEKQG